jgi:hypothetical protein
LLPWTEGPLHPETIVSHHLASKLISCTLKGFRLKPEAARQFDMLKAEVSGRNGKDKGPVLIAEALNLLFEKYGKPPVD